MKEKNRIQFSDSDFPDRQLPDGHREEFLKKLGSTQKAPAKKKKNNWAKIAAVIVVLTSLGVLLGYNLTKEEHLENKRNNEIAQQVKEVEAEYLNNIAKEWEKFLALATDKKLVARYRKKLSQLDADYKEISEMYQSDKNNISAVEDIIRNLQTRLALLKDIQEHIKLLNQKDEQL